MIRSLFTGVSGAKAHQKKLDVVGNNIANINTTGFKKSTVAFQDLLSQLERGAMGADGNRGGVNPKQVGLGVRVGAIETIHTQGFVSHTGVRTDMAIQGEGYYIVKAGTDQYYTRAGNFTLDKEGNLVMSGNGYRVQGNEVTSTGGVDTWGAELTDINIPLGQKFEPKATSLMGYRCNLDARAPVYDEEDPDPSSTYVTKSSIYDNLGTEHTVNTTWRKIADNRWSWNISLGEEDSDITVTGGSGEISFGTDGKIVPPEENPKVTIGFSSVGMDDSEIELDFAGKAFDKDEIDGVTQFGSAFTTKPYFQDGYKMGTMNDFYVTGNGKIVGSYDNGQIKSLYNLPLAMFSNSHGLSKVGNTCFDVSANSGTLSVENAMEGGAGSISGGALEASNVDMTDEFTHMILAQRGYQSNARVITTSDTVLEEAINLKR